MFIHRGATNTSETRANSWAIIRTAGAKYISPLFIPPPMQQNNATKRRETTTTKCLVSGRSTTKPCGAWTPWVPWSKHRFHAVPAGRQVGSGLHLKMRAMRNSIPQPTVGRYVKGERCLPRDGTGPSGAGRSRTRRPVYGKQNNHLEFI